MALDEYLYGKLANFFKSRKKQSVEEDNNVVKLEDVKSRLTIFARAITGEPIDIYPAEREGGYKSNNFFLPIIYNDLNDYEKNLSFYLYRVLYLSVQKNLSLNWKTGIDHDLKMSQEKALESSPTILNTLFQDYPISKQIHADLLKYYSQFKTDKKPADYTFLYGKWMRDSKENNGNALRNFNNKAKKAIESEITTILKANPVEDIITIEVDKKQQEDFVMTHNFEKIDTAEEHDGGWRDFDGDDELDKHSKALEELNMKYTVRVDDTSHSVYQADFVENISVSESAESLSNDFSIAYDEWDYAKRTYKENFTNVYPKKITDTKSGYYSKTIKDNASTLLGLRKMLTSVNNKLQQQRRQNQGEEFDLDALTDLYIDVHSGHTPSENVYLSKRKKEKDISILLLLDVSLSSDGYANNNRVIDVERQVSILFGEILNEFNVDFSINAFFSKTRNYSTYLTLKGFDDEWDKAKHKIGAVEPEGYTRIGAAIRHSGALLDQRSTKNKWIVLISDGKPNDFDKYEGKYGINDVKQALRELNERQINSYALAIEASAKYYLPQMFGANHYEILTTPVELLQALVKLYEKIKTQN
jgi:nitric oxide reductase NorD protein